MCKHKQVITSRVQATSAVESELRISNAHSRSRACGYPVAIETDVRMVNGELGIGRGCIVGYQTIHSVLDERVVHHHVTMLSGFNAVRSGDHYTGVVDPYLDSRGLVVGCPDPHAADVLDHCVDDMSRGLCSLPERNVDAVLVKAEDNTVLDVEVPAGNEPNAVEPGVAVASPS